MEVFDSTAPQGLEFPPPLFARMQQLAEAAYPHEGCGVLVGVPGIGTSVVTEVAEGRNLVTDRSHDRYELDPRDIIAAERRARERGEELLGYYHTHPDHPARPSQFDTDHAWPGYHYVVISVQRGRQVRATAWTLTPGEASSHFAEVALTVGGSAPEAYNPPGIVAEKS